MGRVGSPDLSPSFSMLCCVVLSRAGTPCSAKHLTTTFPPKANYLNMHHTDLFKIWTETEPKREAPFHCEGLWYAPTWVEPIWAHEQWKQLMALIYMLSQAFFKMRCVALYFVELHWVVLTCIELYCAGLCWVALSCVVLLWVALSWVVLYCVEFYYTGLCWIVLCCSLLRWVALSWVVLCNCATCICCILFCRLVLHCKSCI